MINWRDHRRLQQYSRKPSKQGDVAQGWISHKEVLRTIAWSWEGEAQVARETPRVGDARTVGGSLKIVIVELVWEKGYEQCRQFDWIWNHLEDTPLGMYMLMFPQWLNWGGMIYPECGWQHPMGWDPRLDNRRNQANNSIHLFLPPGFRCNMTSQTMLTGYLPHHDGLYPFEPWAQMNHSFHNFFVVGVLSQQWEKPNEPTKH